MSALLETRTPSALPPPTSPPSTGAHPLALLATGGSLYIALLAGLASLNGVIEGFGWLYSLWLPLLLIHATGAIVRGSRLPSWLAPLACAVVVAGILGFHPALQDRALGPNWTTRFTRLLENARLEFATQVPEVAFTVAVDFTLFLVALTLALMIEILASVRRLAGLVVLPLAFAPVVASLFKLSGAGTGYLLVILAALICYFAFLPYVWPSPQRGALPDRRRLGMTGILALLTTVVLLATSAWVPGFRQGMLPEGHRPSGELFASNLDPLLDLGRDLRSNNKATAFTYFTSAQQAPYLRTHVISNLQAERWEPDPDPITRDFSGTTPLRDVYRSLATSDQYTELTWAQPPRDSQLPLPTDSYLVEGIVGRWQWEPLTSVARFTTASREATNQVRVWHNELQMDADLARNFANFPQLSPGVDPSLSRLPQTSVAGLLPALGEHLQIIQSTLDAPSTDFDRAVAIQDYLRSTNFSYSEQTPLREGYDGANLQVITAFLDRRAGYCVHFASTMALMARAVGIPSRVVIGYAPGERTGETRSLTAPRPGSRPNTAASEPLELIEYRVSGEQAHAWPELYLPGLGWTAFEPTPGRGIAPEYAPAPETTPIDDIPPEQLPEAPEELVPSAAVPTIEAEETAPAPALQNPTGTAWRFSWLLLPVFLLVAAVPLWRRNRAHRKLTERMEAGGAVAAAALWQELLLSGADYGHPQRSGDSEADYCAALSLVIPDESRRLDRLAHQLEQSFYALRHPTAAQVRSLRADLIAIRGALRGKATAVQRLCSLYWPAQATHHRPAPADAHGGANHSAGS